MILTTYSICVNWDVFRSNIVLGVRNLGWFGCAKSYLIRNFGLVESGNFGFNVELLVWFGVCGIWVLDQFVYDATKQYPNFTSIQLKYSLTFLAAAFEALKSEHQTQEFGRWECVHNARIEKNGLMSSLKFLSSSFTPFIISKP